MPAGHALLDGRYTGGILRWISGANVGEERVVADNSTTTVTVSAAFTNTPGVGDAFVIVPGLVPSSNTPAGVPATPVVTQQQAPVITGTTGAIAAGNVLTVLTVTLAPAPTTNASAPAALLSASYVVLEIRNTANQTVTGATITFTDSVDGGSVPVHYVFPAGIVSVANNGAQRLYMPLLGGVGAVAAVALTYAAAPTSGETTTNLQFYVGPVHPMLVANVVETAVGSGGSILPGDFAPNWSGTLRISFATDTATVLNIVKKNGANTATDALDQGAQILANQEFDVDIPVSTKNTYNLTVTTGGNVWLTALALVDE